MLYFSFKFVCLSNIFQKYAFNILFSSNSIEHPGVFHVLESILLENYCLFTVCQQATSGVISAFVLPSAELLEVQNQVACVHIKDTG